MALDYFQIISDEPANEYAVTLSFNGQPNGDPIPLPYEAPEKHYLVGNILPGINKTYLLETDNRTSHVTGYGAHEAVRILEADEPSPLQVRGGGIIKTTNYPPPSEFIRKSYSNDAALAWVYLKELTITRNGQGNFLVSGKVKKFSDQANFSLKTNVRLVTGYYGRVYEVLEIGIDLGANSEASFLPLTLNNANHGASQACSIIIHTGDSLNFALPYQKSGWFYMED